MDGNNTCTARPIWRELFIGTVAKKNAEAKDDAGTQINPNLTSWASEIDDNALEQALRTFAACPSLTFFSA